MCKFVKLRINKPDGEHVHFDVKLDANDLCQFIEYALPHVRNYLNVRRLALFHSPNTEHLGGVFKESLNSTKARELFYDISPVVAQLLLESIPGKRHTIMRPNTKVVIGTAIQSVLSTAITHNTGVIFSEIK